MQPLSDFNWLDTTAEAFLKWMIFCWRNWERLFSFLCLYNWFVLSIKCYRTIIRCARRLLIVHRNQMTVQYLVRHPLVDWVKFGCVCFNRSATPIILTSGRCQPLFLPSRIASLLLFIPLFLLLLFLRLSLTLSLTFFLELKRTESASVWLMLWEALFKYLHTVR